MKKIQIEQKASQQVKASSRKKRPVLWILIPCLLLGCGMVVSASLLGSSISRFSKEDVNVISLVPAEEDYSEFEGKENSAAGSVGSPQHTTGTTSYIAGQSDEYHGELQVYDDIQTWSSETWVDLFRGSYDGTVKSSDEEKVIAPGTSNFYDFSLKNNSNTPLDYSVSLKVETYLGEHDTYSSIPLEWRLLAGDGTVLSDWQGYNERTGVLEQRTIKVRHQDNYTVEWRWDFERGEGMDKADTNMGNIAVVQPLGVNAAIYVYAEQGAGWSGGESGSVDALKTGDTFNILLYIVLMAISACGMVIFFVINRRRKMDEDVKDDQK